MIRKCSLIELFFNHSVGVSRAFRRLGEHEGVFSGRNGTPALDPKLAIGFELAFELVLVEVAHQGCIGTIEVFSVKACEFGDLAGPHAQWASLHALVYRRGT